RALVLRARTILCETLGIEAPAPESMIGSLATVPLPPGLAPSPEGITGTLFERHHIEVPTWFWPAAPARILRVSAQVYNDESQYIRLAAALTEVLAG
ncbi:MAG TPA: aminotransferase, partial [Vicinamibacteria bacterium]|nr:aminotransferase [Vicinamibacteria bacterium]